MIAVFHEEDKHHRVAIQLERRENRFLASTLSIAEVMPRAIEASIGAKISVALKRLVDEFVEVDEEVAYLVAELRSHRKMKTPDAIISATAQLRKAQLWTFDAKLAKATPGARCLA
jgi:predicted nucleic acid-binding protein